MNYFFEVLINIVIHFNEVLDEKINILRYLLYLSNTNLNLGSMCYYYWWQRLNEKIRVKGPICTGQNVKKHDLSCLLLAYFFTILIVYTQLFESINSYFCPAFTNTYSDLRLPLFLFFTRFLKLLHYTVSKANIKFICSKMTQILPD